MSSNDVCQACKLLETLNGMEGKDKLEIAFEEEKSPQPAGEKGSE